MCGELDEEDRFEGDLCHRFLVRAAAMRARRPAGGSDEEDLNAYLDRLQADLLGRLAAEVQRAGPKDAYRRMAMQSLVLARLAGFLAGHVALTEDPLRKLIEAAMHGYGEADMPRPDHDHHHHDDGGHERGHGHHHPH